MTAAERWLFSPGSARRLAAIRIGLCGILAVRLGRGVFIDLAGQPRALYRPRSFMHVFGQMPPRAAVLGLQVAGVAAAILAAVGLRARVTLPVAWGAGVVLLGMTTSLGKVVHNDVFVLLAMVPLLAAPGSEAWAVDARGAPDRVSARFGWPVRTAMVVVAGAFFFAGFAKLAGTGPGWVTSDSMRWIMYAASDDQAGNAAALFIADRPWLAHMVAAAIVALELGFIAVLWVPRAAWLLVPGAVGFVIGIRITIGLDYWPWAATTVVVFVDWPVVIARLRRRPPVTLAPGGI